MVYSENRQVLQVRFKKFGIDTDQSNKFGPGYAVGRIRKGNDDAVSVLKLRIGAFKQVWVCGIGPLLWNDTFNICSRINPVGCWPEDQDPLID